MAGPVGGGDCARENRLDTRFLERIDVGEVGLLDADTAFMGSFDDDRTIQSGFQSVCPATRTLTCPSSLPLTRVIAGSFPVGWWLSNRIH
jgi:hypothetical protein